MLKENFKQIVKAYKNNPDVNHLFIMIRYAGWLSTEEGSWTNVLGALKEILGEEVDWFAIKQIERQILQ